MSVGLIINGIILIFMGPDPIFGYDTNLTLFLACWVLFGVSESFINIPCVPELMENLSEIFPN